ncbi:hypothetical protein XELAEV_18015746mg [Xenopus laevis]|uniref:Uncharacterized protein n=1 Tax=Xenopus laevis TaxID=8355 RepID=A0A974DIL8_XENLA|nr:hypothetical protein XELAEV_18015746mg [Xenopus laevis]
MINKDLSDHHTYPEEATAKCFGNWSSLIYSLITDSTEEAFLVPEKSGLLFCFGYYVLYDLAVLVSRKSLALW